MVPVHLSGAGTGYILGGWLHCMRFRLDIDWFVLVIGVRSAVTWVEALIKGSTMRRKLLFFVFLLHCASHLFQKGEGVWIS